MHSKQGKEMMCPDFLMKPAAGSGMTACKNKIAVVLQCTNPDPASRAEVRYAANGERCGGIPLSPTRRQRGHRTSIDPSKPSSHVSIGQPTRVSAWSFPPARLRRANEAADERNDRLHLEARNMVLTVYWHRCILALVPSLLS